MKAIPCNYAWCLSITRTSQSLRWIELHEAAWRSRFWSVSTSSPATGSHSSSEGKSSHSSSAVTGSCSPPPNTKPYPVDRHHSKKSLPISFGFWLDEATAFKKQTEWKAALPMPLALSCGIPCHSGTSALLWGLCSAWRRWSLWRESM